MKKDKCIIILKDNKRCKKPYYISCRVRVFHPNSNRKTWQTWHFCKEHFEIFVDDNGKGWFWDYLKESKPKCPVIDYKLLI